MSKEKEILKPEQQKQVAEFLDIEIAGKDLEEAQKLIDEKMSEIYGLRAIEMVTLGQPGARNKFVLVESGLGKDRYFYLILGDIKEYRGHSDLVYSFLNPPYRKHLRGRPRDIVGGLIDIFQERGRKIARVWGTSYGFQGYKKSELEAPKEHLKEKLNVDEVAVEKSGPY
jgi:hypothetical protein